MERPPSNWAQIIQATVSICILIVALITYFFSIIPVQRLVEVEERRVIAERQLKEIKSAYADFIVITRGVVIDVFIDTVVTRAKMLAHPVGGERVPNNIRFSDAPGDPVALYKKIRIERPINYREPDPNSKATTGMAIISENLPDNASGSLPASDHKRLIEMTRKFVLGYHDPRAFSENLKADTFSPRSNEEASAEPKRHYQAHEGFSKAVHSLEQYLRKEFLNYDGLQADLRNRFPLLYKP